MSKIVTFNLNNHEWYIRGNKALNLLDTTSGGVILDKDTVDIILSRGFNIEIHIHKINEEFRITSEELSIINKYRDNVKLNIEHSDELYFITASTYLNTITYIRATYKKFAADILKFTENEGKVAPNKIMEPLNKNDIATIINVIYNRHMDEPKLTTIYKIDGKIYWSESLREAQNHIFTKYKGGR